MAANKKPRKRYKPRPILWDTMAYVKQELTPVSQHDSYLLDLQLKNSQAMSALLRGSATKHDMETLFAMLNITQSLQTMGFGTDYLKVAADGDEALASIALRSVKLLRFTPTGPEITALNELMELHDAQMEFITIQQMGAAIDLTNANILKGLAASLPSSHLGSVAT